MDEHKTQQTNFGLFRVGSLCLSPGAAGSSGDTQRYLLALSHLSQISRRRSSPASPLIPLPGCLVPNLPPHRLSALPDARLSQSTPKSFHPAAPPQTRRCPFLPGCSEWQQPEPCVSPLRSTEREDKYCPCTFSQLLLCSRVISCRLSRRCWNWSSRA